MNPIPWHQTILIYPGRNVSTLQAQQPPLQAGVWLPVWGPAPTPGLVTGISLLGDSLQKPPQALPCFAQELHFNCILTQAPDHATHLSFAVVMSLHGHRSLNPGSTASVISCLHFGPASSLWTCLVISLSKSSSLALLHSLHWEHLYVPHYIHLLFLSIYHETSVLL